MEANNFDRRGFLITGCAVAAFAASPIAAATPRDAEKLITRLTKKTLTNQSRHVHLTRPYSCNLKKYSANMQM